MKPDELKKLDEVYSFMQAMRRFDKIPLDVKLALSRKLGVDETRLATSSKGATTENQTVNESGAASYTVMKNPDGFLQVRINGTVHYIPYFT